VCEYFTWHLLKFSALKKKIKIDLEMYQMFTFFSKLRRFSLEYLFSLDCLTIFPSKMGYTYLRVTLFRDILWCNRLTKISVCLLDVSVVWRCVYIPYNVSYSEVLLTSYSLHCVLCDLYILGYTVTCWYSPGNVKRHLLTFVAILTIVPLTCILFWAIHVPAMLARSLGYSGAGYTGTSSVTL